MMNFLSIAILTVSTNLVRSSFITSNDIVEYLREIKDLEKLQDGDRKRIKRGPFQTMFPEDVSLPDKFDEDDVGKPLFLTPFIESGQIRTAQELSRVQNLSEIETFSGFLTVNKKFDSNLFFWFVPARFDVSAPLVLWLQGGPGGSSLFGLFVEHGPFFVNSELNLEMRPTAWSVPFNMLYIDQPVGTGFSFTKDIRGYAMDQNEVANDLYEAMRQFYLLFPHLKLNDLYITGESYAGKYVPAISHKIHVENKKLATKKRQIPLKGIAIGDGLCDPINQLDYGDFLFQVGLVDEAVRDLIDNRTRSAKKSINDENWGRATEQFGEILDIFARRSGLNFYYNYMLSDQPVEFTYYPKFLAVPAVRKAIHVGNLTYDGISMIVHQCLNDDMMKTVRPWIETLLENYKVMVYNGQLDVIIAFPQTENFLMGLNWSGKYDYSMARRKIWKVDGKVAGYVREAKNLIQVMVRNAGHILPFDQPKWAFDMMQRFVVGKSFD